MDVAHVLRERSMEMSFTENQQVVQAFTPYTFHKPFPQSVRSGCLHRRAKDCDSSGVRNPIEQGSQWNDRLRFAAVPLYLFVGYAAERKRTVAQSYIRKEPVVPL